MPAPGEHKTVQARILKYAEEIGWTFVLSAEAWLNEGRVFQPAVKQWWTGMSVHF